jgi:assimilatory nitrate reductase catalytic subunit
LCSKGAALTDTLFYEGRLLVPRLNGATVGLETALDAVAEGFRRVIDTHGPDAVAFYVSGQLLTEDYYVANKLIKGFIGSSNIDTNSRLCMSSAVSAQKRAFGEDAVPLSYEDLDHADLIVLVGSNTAWCHPVLFQRILKARETRPGVRLVVIDPRRTPTSDLADLHLPLRPGTDVMLFNGLLAWLAQHDAINHEFVTGHTNGAGAALLAAENTAGEAQSVSRYCGLDVASVRRFYEWFVCTDRVVTAFSQGVNQSSCGTDKVNSIINVHLLTGRIGRVGMGPFSLTGQPNAMGGREVGGLANMLAAHLDLDNIEHRKLVSNFWNAPRLADGPGLKAVDMFEAMLAGRVKAVWIMATNPAVSLPNADRARAALQRCDLVVVSDCVTDTDTARLAHILLPAAAWGEKNGTVTNSDRRISRQRAFLSPPVHARPDWWLICQVAARLGFASNFAYASPADIFDEHARLTAAHTCTPRLFDIGGLAGLGNTGYAALEPVQWPVPAGTLAGTPRLFADGRFCHPDGRARFVAIRPGPPRFGRDDEYPLVLNTGRIRDQWHSMTRTGRSARLQSHLPEPFVDMHPADALSFGLRPGSLVRVVTAWGRLVVRLRCSGELARGAIFVPIHWSDTSASDARVGALVNPALDPISGQPEFKHTPARVEPFVVSWYGFALTRRPLGTEQFTWWCRSLAGASLRYELAGRHVPGDWSSWARELFATDAPMDWIEYSDRAAGTYRAALMQNEQLESCLFISRRPELPSRTPLASIFDSPRLSTAERTMLLSGRPADPRADEGAILCACFGVGRRSIRNAIEQGCIDMVSIGRRLGAGTNCGSCIPEMRRLIASALGRAAPAGIPALPD